MQITMNMYDAALDVQSLLPHRAPFLLVDGVSLKPEHCQCPEGTLWQASGVSFVRDTNPFVCEDASLEPVALAEMLAQCAAALGLLPQQTVSAASVKAQTKNVENSVPPIGYLAAMRPVRMLGRVHVGDALRLFVRQTAAVGAISLVEGKVFLGQACVAQAQFKIFVQGTE